MPVGEASLGVCVCGLEVCVLCGDLTSFLELVLMEEGPDEVKGGGFALVIAVGDGLGEGVLSLSLIVAVAVNTSFDEPGIVVDRGLGGGGVEGGQGGEGVIVALGMEEEAPCGKEDEGMGGGGGAGVDGALKGVESGSQQVAVFVSAGEEEEGLAAVVGTVLELA